MLTSSIRRYYTDFDVVPRTYTPVHISDGWAIPYKMEELSNATWDLSSGESMYAYCGNLRSDDWEDNYRLFTEIPTNTPCQLWYRPVFEIRLSSSSTYMPAGSARVRVYFLEFVI